MLTVFLAFAAASGFAQWHWDAKPDWLANPAQSFSARWAGDRWVFEVREAGRGMKWSGGRDGAALLLDPGGYLVIEYRAINVAPGDDYAVWLGRLGQADRTALSLSELCCDGRWHTVAVDVDAREIAGPVLWVAVEVQAARAPATVELRRLEFSPAPPPGAEVIPAQPPKLAKPWRDDCNTAAGWRARPDWLGNPDPRARIFARNGVLRLEVSQAGLGMKFSRPLTQPVDLAALPYLAVRYRARGLAPHGDYFIYFGSAEGGMPPKAAYPIRIRGLRDDGAWHVAVAHITEGFKAREMALQIQADQPGAFIEVDYIALYPHWPRAPLSDVVQWRRGWVAAPAGLKPLPPPTGRTRVAQLLPSVRGWFSARRVTVAGVPFAVGGADRIAATPLLGTGDVTIRVGAQASEFYLLLAVRLSHYGVVNYSTEPVVRQAVRLPEELVVCIEYTDGQVDEAFPALLPDGRYEVYRGLGAYVVPVPQCKKVARVAVRDRMAFGAVGVAAVTANLGSALHPAEFALNISPGEVDAGAGAARPTLATAARETAPARPPAVQLDAAGRLVRIAEAAQLTLRPAVPFAVKRDGEQVAIRAASVTNAGDTIRADYSLADGSRAALVLLPRGGELQLKLTFTPAASGKYQVVFPRLAGLRLGAAASDDWLFLPRRAAQITRRPGRYSAQLIGGNMPLQFLALYDAGGCFYLRGLERWARWRQVTIDKSLHGCDLTATFWQRSMSAGERFVSAWAIGLGRGDWHVAFAAHRRWLAAVSPPPLSPRKQWFRRVFAFHQRFAHGEPWIGHDGRWSVDHLIVEDKKAFGRAEYFHFFDWGASKKYGRVGDYCHYDELGGLAAFRDGVQRLQRRGVRVGLYFEGYLVDSRSLAGRAHLDEWAMLDAAGKRQMWPGSATETVVCPFCPSWQKYLAETVRRVESEVGADGYYLDELGFAGRVCWSDRHGHEVPAPAVRGELELIRAVRQRLPAGRALYTEETPVDVGLYLLDGAFTYAVRQWVAWRPARAPLAVVRFAAPDFKTFEIPTFQAYRDPAVWTAAKYVFFNGEGLWFQGRPSSFSPEALALLRRMFSIMSQHADAFSSTDVQPLIPTLIPGVYCNAFTARGCCGRETERVFTLYNSLHHTVRGEVIRVRHQPGARYMDLWAGRPLRPRIRRGWAYLSATLGPQQVGCLAQVW